MRQTEIRNEIKFITEPHRRYFFVERILQSRLMFFEEYQPRRVNNIYFDTVTLAAFDENLGGVSTRNKLRYRWYGESISHENGTLEVKCKRGLDGWKLLFPVEAPFGEEALLTEIRPNLISQLPGEGKVWLDHFDTPVLFNRYRRRYFRSRSEDIRVTIDWEQQAYSQLDGPRLNIGRRANNADCIVIELKFKPENKELAYQISRELHLKVGRFSKYVEGVNSILF